MRQSIGLVLVCLVSSGLWSCGQQTSNGACQGPGCQSEDEAARRCHSSSCRTPPPPSCGSGCLCAAANAWASIALSAPQTETFELSFDATPGVTGTDDEVIGVSSGSAAAYTDLAVIVRFSSTGAIDVINGDGYASAGTVTYAAGTTYHFTIDVNLPSRTADYYVTPAGGSKVSLGTGYAFRTSQASASQLGTLDLIDSASSASTVCNIAVTAWSPSSDDGGGGGNPSSCAHASAGFSDGCDAALSSGTVVSNFFSGFASGFTYPVRPAWDVAGVDYAVGAPTSGQTYLDPTHDTLPAGCTVSGTTVTCSNDNTTLSGWDFTLHGGIQLVLEGNGDTVTKSKFAAGTNCVDPIIRVDASSGTFTMTYSSMDGGSTTGCNGSGVFQTEIAAGGTASSTYVLHHNYFTHAWQDVLDFSSGAVDIKYNYFYNNGLPTNHSDDFQSCGGDFPSVAIQFNTVFNSYADGYWTQPLHVEAQCTSSISNVVASQNTVVAISGTGTGCNGGADWPVNCSANGLMACKDDGGPNYVHGFSAYQNYFDWDGALGAIIDDCTGNPNATNISWGTPSPNVDLRTGTTFTK